MGKLLDAMYGNQLKVVKKLLKKKYRNSPLINDEKDEHGSSALHN